MSTLRACGLAPPLCRSHIYLSRHHPTCRGEYAPLHPATSRLPRPFADSTTPALAQRGGRGNDSTGGRGAGLAAHAGEAAQVHDRRGHVALARPLARRPHDRLRAARRHLHDSRSRAARRRASRAASRSTRSRIFRPTASRSSSSATASQSDNLWIMNADGIEPARAHARERSEVPVADVHARRQVRRRVEGQRHLHVLRQRRRRRPASASPATRAAAGAAARPAAVAVAAPRRTSSSDPRRAKTAATSTSRCATARAAATTRPRSAGRSACSIAKRGTSSRRRTRSAAACVPSSAPTAAGSPTRRATTPRRR